MDTKIDVIKSIKYMKSNHLLFVPQYQAANSNNQNTGYKDSTQCTYESHWGRTLWYWRDYKGQCKHI